MPLPVTPAMLGLWAGMTAVAVVVATAGVNMVASQVTEPSAVVIHETPGGPSPRDDASARAPQDGQSASDSASSTPTDQDDDVKPSIRATEGDDGVAPRGSATPRATPSDRDDAEPSPAPSKSAEDSASDAPSPSSSASAKPSEGDDDEEHEAVAETRTASAIGGQASFRFENGKVTLLWASPATGFRVEMEEERDDRVELRFVSETHESSVRADFSDGESRVRVEEDSRDDDDHEQGSSLDD